MRQEKRQKTNNMGKPSDKQPIKSKNEFDDLIFNQDDDSQPYKLKQAKHVNNPEIE